MNAKQVWQAALGELQVKVPGPSYQTWLKNTSIAAFEGNNVVVIAVPSNFAKEWLENRFSKLIAETLNNVLGYKVEVRFEVKNVGRGETGRALQALEGVGTDTEARYHQIAVGEQEYNAFAVKGTGTHGIPVVQATGSGGGQNEPKQLHPGRDVPAQQPVSNASFGQHQASNITSINRGGTGVTGNNRSGGGVPISSVKRNSGGSAYQFEMPMEEASML